MRLKKRLESFNKFLTEEPIIENIETPEILNEDTEGYSEGQAYGKAFQAAIVLGIAVMIAVTRARARMKKKMAWIYQRSIRCLFTFHSRFWFCGRTEHPGLCRQQWWQ